MPSKLVTQLTKVFQAMIDNPATSVRIWEGKVPIINPTTKQPTGNDRITCNLDMVVSPSVYAKASEHMEIEDKKGDWVKISVFGKEMVLIALREDKVNERLIAQFAVPNQGSWTEVGNSVFQSEFERLFGNANKHVQSTPKSNESLKSAVKKELQSLSDDEFERILNS